MSDRTPHPAEAGEKPWPQIDPEVLADLLTISKRLADLKQTARDLVDAVMIDEGGTPGMAGNGGLLSRETIHKANQLRRILDEGDSDDRKIS